MIETSTLIVVAQPNPNAPAPLPPEAEPAPAPELDDTHDTRRLPPLTWQQRAELWLRITADRLHRGTPWFAAGVGLVIAALALLLVLAPTPAAQAIVLARPTVPPLVLTATPSLLESLPRPTAAPVIAAPPAPVVVEPTAAPVELQPAPVVVAQAAPTPVDLVPIVEPAGDGGTWVITEHPGGVSDATYIPPPNATPIPTPHFGAMNGGGGSWD